MVLKNWSLLDFREKNFIRNCLFFDCDCFRVKGHREAIKKLTHARGRQYMGQQFPHKYKKKNKLKKFNDPR